MWEEYEWSEERRKRTSNVMLYKRKSNKEELKKLEKLLYLYPQMKKLIIQSQREIKLLALGIITPPTLSDSILKPSLNPNQQSREERIEEYINGRKSTLKRTMGEISKLETAIAIAKGHYGYILIPYKYFKEFGFLTDEEVMETLKISRTTFYRWRIELLEIMASALFENE